MNQLSTGTRDVVDAAHRFVQSYVNDEGIIPSNMIFGMGHMLAHCGMTNLMIFLESYGFQNPKEFEDFVQKHDPDRIIKRR